MRWTGAVRVGLILASGACPDLLAAGSAEGFAWLDANQNPDGSWGSAVPILATSTVLETLASEDACLDAVDPAAAWLSAQEAANLEFLARQIGGLAAIPSFQAETALLAGQLLAARNPAEPNNALPNWPEGGWGIAEDFATDCLTTALGLLALDRAGFNGGFAVASGSVPAGGSDVRGWEIPADAIKVRLLVSVGGANVRLCMTEGAPPPSCNPYFPLPPGGPYQIVFPDSGLPFTPGTNFVVLQSTGPAASYTLDASYETPTFDTRTLAEPLHYLQQAQNVDGGWGLQRGQDTGFYASLHVLLALQRYGQYDLGGPIAAGLTYLKDQQLGDGSFGFEGTGIPYATALAALNLVRSQTSPFDPETEGAIAAVTAAQELDGSWSQEAYDTALALQALREHAEPPTANAGPDQIVPDPEEDCSEPITLSGSGSAVNATIVAYEWREGCTTIATGANPVVGFSAGEHVVTLTVTDSNGRTATDLVRITVIDAGTDLDDDGFTVCGGDCDDADNSIWHTPGEVLNLLFSSQTALAWDAPFEPGSYFPSYDVLRSPDGQDFVGTLSCVESDDDSDLQAQDTDTPPAGSVFHYLVRAENGCPAGMGSLGVDSAGVPRIGGACP